LGNVISQVHREVENDHGLADYQKAAAALIDARKAVQTAKTKVKRATAGVFGLK